METQTLGTARIYTRILAWLVPLVLFLTGLRLTLTPPYVQLSYRVPGFPADSYGFTREDRLRWAGKSLDYLLNDEHIGFLGELEFRDGEPVFNQRELRHMQDVKRLTQAALLLWSVTLAGAAALVLILWRMGYAGQVWISLHRGARLTLIIMAVLVVLLVTSFSAIFVGFHRVFFEGNTWLFPYSDTLIRLFPERFWQQVFAFLSLVTAGLAAGAYAVSTWRLGKVGVGPVGPADQA